jgi:hypothetical protein
MLMSFQLTNLVSSGCSSIASTTNLIVDEAAPAAMQIVGVAILEFGVIFRKLVLFALREESFLSQKIIDSMIIGLTLGVTSNFVTLFVVIVFHRKFSL